MYAVMYRRNKLQEKNFIMQTPHNSPVLLHQFVHILHKQAVHNELHNRHRCIGMPHRFYYTQCVEEHTHEHGHTYLGWA